jgi:2-polyprenyl-3-methyl-5-hydroxy-6-metoxy-1,4-benzoquinol methylase
MGSITAQVRLAFHGLSCFALLSLNLDWKRCLLGRLRASIPFLYFSLLGLILVGFEVSRVNAALLLRRHRAGDRVLDIGCGYGAPVRLFAKENWRLRNSDYNFSRLV